MSEGKHRRDLVEPEGVNSGSAEDLMGGAGRHVRPGGHPERSEQAEESPPGPEVVRTPWAESRAGEPSLEQSREEGAS
jgi:hypothetical protein